MSLDYGFAIERVHQRLREEDILFLVDQGPAPCEEQELLQGIPRALANFYRQCGQGLDLAWFVDGHPSMANKHPTLDKQVFGALAIPPPRHLLVEDKRHLDENVLEYFREEGPREEFERLSLMLRNIHWVDAIGNGDWLCLDLGRPEVPVVLYAYEQLALVPIAPSFEEYFLRCAEHCFTHADFSESYLVKGGAEAVWSSEENFPPLLRIERAELIR